LSGIVVEISHPFSFSLLELKSAAGDGSADGDLVDNLLETIDKISFLWLDLWCV
jgi:hypothetical protein